MVKDLINTRSSRVRSFTAAIVLLVISVMMISTNTASASAAAAEEAAYVTNGDFLTIDGDDQWGNATTTAGTGGRIEEMEEFLMMDSEANRRQLASTRPTSLSYDSIQKGPICNAQLYGNCIGQKINSGRPNQCTFENRCPH